MPEIYKPGSVKYIQCTPLAIYLVAVLLPHSSGLFGHMAGNQRNNRDMASLQQTGFTNFQLSPVRIAGSYPARFTLTLFRRFRFCGTFPRVAPGCC